LSNNSSKRVCVFCGSNTGSRAVYMETAAQLGRLLAARGIGVVYGGGHVGLMGAVADGALAAGGEVIGVIPRALFDKEIAHRGLTELRVVGSMHERKALMADLSSGFIAMPGGYGTLDEFCEVLTWSQLGIQQKPCAILNVEGFFDSFLGQLDRAVKEGFLSPLHRDYVLMDHDAERLLTAMSGFKMRIYDKWAR
jgi:uncharacterized protein (TIGR00730 family)